MISKKNIFQISVIITFENPICLIYLFFRFFLFDLICPKKKFSRFPSSKVVPNAILENNYFDKYHPMIIAGI